MGIDVTVLRGFTDSHRNFGNPLGVVDASQVEPSGRQDPAAQLGYSETIFVDLPTAGATTAHATWVRVAGAVQRFRCNTAVR